MSYIRVSIPENLWIEVRKEVGSPVWMRVQVRSGVIVHVQLRKSAFPIHWNVMVNYMKLINETIAEIMEQEGVTISPRSFTFTVE